MSILIQHVKRNLEAAKISASVFAPIAGLKISTLTSILRETMIVHGHEESRLHTLALRCAAIKDALAPLTLENGDWKSLAALVQSDLSPEELAEKVHSIFNSSQQ